MHWIIDGFLFIQTSQDLCCQFFLDVFFASSRVVELEEELQMAANDSAKVPYSSIFIDFPWSKATESIWKWYFSIIFLEFSIYVSLQAVAPVDQLQQEMDLWPHLANIISVWHSLCFGHVTYIACPLRILTCICCQCVCVCARVRNRSWRRRLRKIRHCRTWEILVYSILTQYTCKNRTAWFHIISLCFDLTTTVDLDVWFTIQRNQSLQQVFDGDDSARSSWMPWQQRKAKHLRTSFLTGQSTNGRRHYDSSMSNKS